MLFKGFFHSNKTTEARSFSVARQPVDRLPGTGELLLDLILLIRARSPRSMSMLRTGAA